MKPFTIRREGLQREVYALVTEDFKSGIKYVDITQSELLTGKDATRLARWLTKAAAEVSAHNYRFNWRRRAGSRPRPAKPDLQLSFEITKVEGFTARKIEDCYGPKI